MSSPLRWKCNCCGEFHTGLPTDFGYDEPLYWRSELQGNKDSFLNSDYCSVENEHFFVRGILHIPILGTDESFAFGVWFSVSRKSLDHIHELEKNADEAAIEAEPPFYGWLANQLPGYPDTLPLKARARLVSSRGRPELTLEPGDHPLVKEQTEGITQERWQELVELFMHPVQ
jgi:hypothetical protein